MKGLFCEIQGNKFKASNKVIVHLDQLRHWEFHYGKKVFKLNVEDFIKLLKKIKK